MSVLKPVGQGTKRRRALGGYDNESSGVGIADAEARRVGADRSPRKQEGNGQQPNRGDEGILMRVRHTRIIGCPIRLSR